MPRATHAGTEIEYVTTGDPDDPALLMVNGLGSQLISWDIELVEAFVDRGFFVIRFDNRDAGLSGRTEAGFDVSARVASLLAGEAAEVPYTLSDMADDALAVMDDLGVGSVHLLGISLGGMIAQTFAIRHPQRTASLTSVMSHTGEAGVGATRPDVLNQILQPVADGREEYIERQVNLFRTIGSPDHFDEDRVRSRAEAAYDRSFNPGGVAVQLLAVLASGDRAEGLARLDVPTFVIHGDQDPLVDVSGGVRTAELVPGAELDVIEGMGHDLPSYFWPRIVEGVTKLAARSAQ
jgi:pimeloyl-ACP methyl ester carboxylesterase